MPGITIGFLTKLILATHVPSEMYHCSVMILIAIFAAYFARKGYYDDIKRTLLLILPLAFLAGTYDLMIDHFLDSANSIKSVRVFAWTFSDNLLREILDKGVMTLLAFALLQRVPKDIKDAFKNFGQMQAPLSEEMRQNLKMENYLSSSLRNKLMAIVMLSSVFVSLSIAIISYLLFKDTIIEDRLKTVDGMATMLMTEVEPEGIDYYIRLGHNDVNYRELEDRLYNVKNSNRSIEHIRFYRFEANGCRMVFDIDANTFNSANPAEIVPLDKDLEPYRNDLITGKPIPPIIFNGIKGYRIILCKPHYDAKGYCQFYISVDYSMNLLAEYMKNFIIKLIALFISCFIFIFVVGVVFIDNHITLPVNTMAYCARNFSYDNKEERNKNIEMIKSLQIKTGDEIENLYQALIVSAENIAKYLESLQLARIQVENMRVKVFAMDELANTDSLTGIRNKTAYQTMTAKLDQKIEDGDAQFCIVMVDVNFLKRVNDTYGHERGNEYLINACRLVCSVFGEEHVYRIGGDEFVVIVDGDKVSLCRYFVKQFQMEMKRKNTNALLEPWEKVSAAVGVAYYDKEVDKTAEEVFKRADAEMYKNKLAMKAQRTD